MNNSITRERLEALANAEYCKSNPGAWLLGLKEVNELARMALAAMDSEPVEMPLDYLQGHKDGLEWAARLAEANHPDTGDWLYDDPIELAKAIRKGPDMPPSQPALDTKPVAYTDERNLGYIDRGRETAYLWGKQNSEASDVALYRHAQQPVDSEPVGYLFHNEYGAVLYSISDDATEGFSLIGPIYSVPQPAPVVPTFDEWLELSGNKPLGWVKDAMRESYDACRAAMLNHPEQHLDMVDHSGDVNEKGGDGNSPVIPEGWQVEAEKLAEMHGMSFVLFRHGEAPQCADPTKVVISFTDKGLGHDTLPAAHQEVK